MTKGDRILVLAVACLVLVSAPLVSLAVGTPRGSAVVRGPAGRSTLDLSRDGAYEVAGKAGTLTLRVSGGQVRCIAADCPDGLCIRTGIARSGRPIVCAPNAVSVTLSTSRDDGIDAVSR